MIGGSDSQQRALASLWRLSLGNQNREQAAPIWREMAAMTERRSSVAVSRGSDDHVYACGGYNDHVSVKSVERYDVSLNQWRPVAREL